MRDPLAGSPRLGTGRVVLGLAVGLVIAVLPVLAAAPANAASATTTTVPTTATLPTSTTLPTPTTLTIPTTVPKGGGCGKKAASGSRTLNVHIAGQARTVIVHVPTDYTGKARVPLVLNMHGSGSTAAQQEAFTGMDGEADLADFIVAYPQAKIRNGSGFDWNIPGVPLAKGVTEPAHPADDLSFLTLLVGSLEGRYCINSARVYATGFSGGARIASQLACDDSNIFAAVAPVSGLRKPDPCPSVRAMPILSFHGTTDPIDPYDGNGQPYWTYSVPDALKDWATQDECRGAAVTTHPAPHVALTRYRSCPGKAVVELYTISGEGHEWPGGPPVSARLTKVFGPQSEAIDADAVMWAFFLTHPLR